MTMRITIVFHVEHSDETQKIHNAEINNVPRGTLRTECPHPPDAVFHMEPTDLHSLTVPPPQTIYRYRCEIAPNVPRGTFFLATHKGAKFANNCQASFLGPLAIRLWPMFQEEHTQKMGPAKLMAECSTWNRSSSPDSKQPMFHVEHWLCLDICFVLHTSFRFAQNL
jgi:hypothetical protein